MNMDMLTSVSGTIGAGFFGGFLIGYALKKVVKLIALIVGLFIGGLAYLQYQQIASFDWNRIEGTISTIANATTGAFNNYKLRYSPYWWYVSRFRDWFYERLMIKNVFQQKQNKHVVFSSGQKGRQAIYGHL